MSTDSRQAGTITEAEILVSGYSVEDFQRRVDLANKAAEDGNRIFASQKRWFGEGQTEIQVEDD